MAEEPDALTIQAERIAQGFHATYEQLAPEHGYETREESAKPWEEVPEQNRGLMVATVRTLIDNGVIPPAPVYLHKCDCGYEGYAPPPHPEHSGHVVTAEPLPGSPVPASTASPVLGESA